MAERTPEEINKMIDGINSILPSMAQPDDRTFLQKAMDGPIFSEEFTLIISSAMRRVRWQGVLDGIRHATGEGELPDIRDMLQTREAMKQYLTPDVISAVLGRRKIING